jgi:glycosyltransferase involved in cell wall biosynthesis
MKNCFDIEEKVNLCCGRFAGLLTCCNSIMKTISDQEIIAAMKIGLLEFNETTWPSVERTRAFYLHVLSTAFETVPVAPDPDGKIAEEMDAVVNFLGDEGWQLHTHPDCPLVFGMHGGAILNQDCLRRHLGRLRTSDLLIVNCSSDAAILRDMFNGPSPLICELPLPVDHQCFRPFSREAARRQLRLNDTDIVLGFVCRLLPQKNLHRFLEMLQQLRKELYPRVVKGLIIGKYWVDYPVLNYETEQYPQYIQSFINSNSLQHELLYFPANLSNEDLAVCYNAMDLLLHPTNSIDENFGYAPVEAMACGTPVIGTAYGGLKDTVIDRETGFLMPSWTTDAGIRMDTQSGIRYAVTLMNDIRLYKQMTEAAYRHAQLFTKEGCGEILKTAVLNAIETFRCQPSPYVQVKASAALTATCNYLPVAKDRWEHYRPQVDYYVSQPARTLDESDTVYLSAKVRHLRDGRLTLDDPAWPATYQLDEQQTEIISTCIRPVTIGTLIHDHRADMNEINRMVHNGLLCYVATSLL